MGAIHRKQMAAVRKAHLFVGQMEASYTFHILFMLRCGFPTGIDGGGTVTLVSLGSVQSALFCPLTFGSCLN